jgi:hypothetical protein
LPDRLSANSTTRNSQDLGDKLLDKFRYLQAFMMTEISYINWFGNIVFQK